MRCLPYSSDGSIGGELTPRLLLPHLLLFIIEILRERERDRKGEEEKRAKERQRGRVVNRGGKKARERDTGQKGRGVLKCFKRYFWVIKT